MNATALRELPVHSIEVPERKRPLDHDHVGALADSINEIGLLSPIALMFREGVPRLVAGAHRLAAFKLLGLETIPFVAVGLDDLRAELAEIDENLIRAKLSDLQMDQQLARRKEIYLELYPETRRGVAGGLASGASRGTTELNSTVPSPKSFVADTAEKLGCTERHVRQSIQIGTDIAPDVQDVLLGTDLADRRNDLLEISRMTHDEQRDVAAAVAERGARTLKEALAARQASPSIADEADSYDAPEAPKGQPHSWGEEPEGDDAPVEGPPADQVDDEEWRAGAEVLTTRDPGPGLNEDLPAKERKALWKLLQVAHNRTRPLFMRRDIRKALDILSP